MIKMLSGLTKAAVGVVVETPLSIAADFVTLGGSINDRDEPYTATAVKKVVKNVQESTEADEK